MELKLVKTEKFNSNQTKLATREFYEIEGYEVEVSTYNDGYIHIGVTKKNTDNKYLPSIYSLHDFEKGVIYGFEIQTTSYGKIMMVDDIREMIKAYEQAIEVVEILTEKFINT